MSSDIVTLHMVVLKPRELGCAVRPWSAVLRVVYFQRHNRFGMKSLRSETRGLGVRSLCTFIYIYIYIHMHGPYMGKQLDDFPQDARAPHLRLLACLSRCC